jgi:hypothetical integral membrane protein (TIGR02206 family)
MSSDFELFGPTHLLIIASLPLLGLLLGMKSRGNPAFARNMRILLGLFLLVHELVWYAFNLYKGWVHFPYGLPLNLCDIVVWLTIVAAITSKQQAFELAYFWGLAGSAMAVLTPDLGVPLISYPGFYFFTAHGGVIVTLLFFVWGRIAEPRQGSFWKAFLILNLYAAFIGLFNAIFKTNYFYLCAKPTGSSPLDYMGTWPLYLLTGELFAILAFWLLWLPFRARPVAKNENPS